MATKKPVINEKLLAAVAATPARKPAPTSADMAFLRGLKKRGYNNFEIASIGKQAGFDVTDKDFEDKPKKEKPAESAAEKLAREERLKKYSAEAAAKAVAAK